MKRTGYSAIAGLEKLTPEEIKARNLLIYGSKIKEYRIRAEMTADELASALRISASSIRNWECGLTRPDPEFIYRMFTILDVEPNEFFGIKGVGTALTKEELALIDDYRKLDAEGKDAVETLAGALVGKTHIRTLRKMLKTETAVPDNERLFGGGECSTLSKTSTDAKKVILYNSPAVNKANEIITISGRSMEPRFHDGDKVLIEYSKNIRNGDIGCFLVPGIGGVIKEKSYDRLHSTNPEYDNIVVNEENAEIIGRVIGAITKEMIPTAEEQSLYIKAVEEKEKHPELFK